MCRSALPCASPRALPRAPPCTLRCAASHLSVCFWVWRVDGWWQWPIFANHTVLFDSESEFESYIKNPAYGSRETPYIHFGRLAPCPALPCPASCRAALQLT
jgi:hypothetical protein